MFVSAQDDAYAALAGLLEGDEEAPSPNVSGQVYCEFLKRFIVDFERPHWLLKFESSWKTLFVLFFVRPRTIHMLHLPKPIWNPRLFLVIYFEFLKHFIVDLEQLHCGS